MPRDEAHRLVADRAVRHQDRRIGAVLAAAREQLRGIDLERDALAAIGRRAVKARGRPPIRPACGVQRRAAGSRTDVLRRRVQAVDRDVRNAQVVLLRGVARIHRIELGAAVVGRAGTLVALVGLKGAAVVMSATRDRLSGFVRGWNGSAT